MFDSLLINVEKVISYSRKTALISFLGGSSILLMYYLTHFNIILYFALFFIVSAFFANVYCFTLLIFHLTKKSVFNKKIIQTIFLLLMNIPIGFIYLEIGLHLYSISIIN